VATATITTIPSQQFQLIKECPLYHPDRNATSSQKRKTQAARCDQNTYNPESQTPTRTSVQLKMALRVLSFSRVEL
jgi:hypothetical protein